MKLALRPIAEQVIVITGAASAIGLAAAKRAGAQGARLLLVDRDAHALDVAVDELRRRGGRAIRMAGDVINPAHADALADAAIAEFGRIDTWVNAAADGAPPQTDVAVRHLRRSGGALINVANGNGAANAALKALTDALRIKLDEEGVPVAVILVRPASDDAPVVGRVIVEVAQRPVPEIVAGSAAMHRRTAAVWVGAIGLGLLALGPLVRRRLVQRSRPPH